MQKHWLIRENNPDLILFVLGWSCDYHAVEHIRPAGYDIFCTYDYTDLEPITPETFTGYRHIYLFAWSFGVWVSEQILKDIPLHKAVALNGSPLPVDDRYGIPGRSLAVTLKGLMRAGTGDFNKRAYGAHYEKIAPYLETRSLEDKYTELRRLHKWASEPYEPALRWTKAVIGRQDIIFPPQNTAAYWGELGETKDLPHYPFADPQTVLEFLDTKTTAYDNR